MYIRKVNSFFITDDGKAYIDLNLEQGMMENMDTRSELLAIYSMVNSLTMTYQFFRHGQIHKGKKTNTIKTFNLLKARAEWRRSRNDLVSFFVEKIWEISAGNFL